MAKRLLFFAFLFSAAACAQSGNITAASSNCTVANSCVAVHLTQNASIATFTITGTFTATLQFEQSNNNGVSRVSLNCTPQPSGAAVTSTTTTGTWACYVGGMTDVFVRGSAYTSGTATVALNVSAAPAQTFTGSLSSGGFTGDSLALDIANHDTVISRVSNGTFLFTGNSVGSGLDIRNSGGTRTGQFAFFGNVLEITEGANSGSEILLLSGSDLGGSGQVDVNTTGSISGPYNWVFDSSGNLVGNLGGNIITAGTVTAANVMPELTTNPQGFACLPHVTCAVGAGSAAFPSGVNAVEFTQFVLPFGMTVRNVRVNITTNVAASHVGCGIYDKTGQTKLVESGALDSSTTGLKTGSSAGVYLAPGVYYYAFTQDTAGIAGTLSSDASSSGAMSTFMTNGSTNMTKRGVSTAAGTAGVLPSSLGTLASASSFAGNIPICYIEP